MIANSRSVATHERIVVNPGARRTFEIYQALCGKISGERLGNEIVVDQRVGYRPWPRFQEDGSRLVAAPVSPSPKSPCR